VRSACALALLGLAGLLAPPAATSATCRIEAGVEPARVVVGEQILHRVRIEHGPGLATAEWIDAPTFPGFRAHRLPGRLGRTDAPSAVPTREEERALFALRAGVLVLPALALRCRDESGATSTALHAPLSVSVAAVPESGRPPDWDGLVGIVRIRTRAEPSRLHLGESLQLQVEVSGDADLWSWQPAFDETNLVAGSVPVEVFPDEDRTDVETGERLHLRRRLRYSLVPRRPGRLLVPPLALATYDPQRGAWQHARSEAIEIEVSAATTSPAASAVGAVAPDADGLAAPAVARSPMSWAPGLLILLGLVSVTLWQLRTRRLRRTRALREALAAAEAERARGDTRAEAAALEQAVRAALARAGSEGCAEAHAALRQLERARYGSEGEPPDRELARAALRRLAP